MSAIVTAADELTYQDVPLFHSGSDIAGAGQIAVAAQDWLYDPPQIELETADQLDWPADYPQFRQVGQGSSIVPPTQQPQPQPPAPPMPITGRGRVTPLVYGTGGVE